jgi:hypothetical protein
MREHTIVILFLRGLICFADDGAVGSSAPAPPRLRALLRPFLVDDDEISLRRGLGWIGAFSPLRDWLGMLAPKESLLA